jgi:hypothetical protein
MNKVPGRTRDELIRNWGTSGVAPANTFPSASNVPKNIRTGLDSERDPLKGIAPTGGESFAPEMLPDVPGPLARAVDPIDPGKDLLDPQPTPAPPVYSHSAPSRIRSVGGNLVRGEDQPLVGLESAPVAGLDRTKEYAPPASRLPMTVSAATVKRENCDRGNMPWDVEPGEVGPMLAGTQMTAAHTPVDRSTEDAFAELRRRGGGY